MAAGLLIPRASKTQNHILTAASFVSQRFHPNLLRGTQFMVSSAVQKADIAEAASSALDLDHKVPATVITRFLSSGKIWTHGFSNASRAHKPSYPSIQRGRRKRDWSAAGADDGEAMDIDNEQSNKKLRSRSRSQSRYLVKSPLEKGARTQPMRNKAACRGEADRVIHLFTGKCSTVKTSRR